MASDKVRENSLRRAAARQGLTLERSRRRDPLALGYGTYGLRRGDALAAGDPETGYGLTLDEIAVHLGRSAQSVHTTSESAEQREEGAD